MILIARIDLYWNGKWQVMRGPQPHQIRLYYYFLQDYDYFFYFTKKFKFGIGLFIKTVYAGQQTIFLVD